MVQTHGETGFFEIGTARKLERKGLVEIMELPKSNLGVDQDTDYLYREAFDKGTATKVAWVQDYDKDGGAELSNYLVVKVGRSLGLDIVGVTSRNLNVKLLEVANVIVVNNFFNFGEDYRQQLLKSLYDGKAPYVKYEHDHREITERKAQGGRLFSSSALNVFISPLQMRNHVQAFGEEIAARSVALPLAVDADRYRLVPEVKRTPGSVLVPAFAKGTPALLDHIVKNPGKQYTVVGRYDFKTNNAKTLPQVPPADMPALYNAHEEVLHLPDKIEGGARILFEAVLCGCRVIYNDNCAHRTWKEQFDWEDRNVLEARLRKAPYEFWRAVCRLKR